MKTQKIYGRILKLILLAVACVFAGLAVGLVAAHQMSIGDIGDVIRGWFIIAVCVLPCGLGVFLFTKAIIDYVRRIPMIQLDETGITDNTNWLLYGTKIEWSEVIGATDMDVRVGRVRQKYVCLMLKNPTILYDTVAPWKRPILRISYQILQGQYFYLNLSLVSISATELLRLVNEYKHQDVIDATSAASANV